MSDHILEIKHLNVHFPIHIGTVKAVNDVTLSIKRGEVMGLVGESGCGKSTLGFSILNLLRTPGHIASGSILYNGRDIVQMSRPELLALRGTKISMIFQDPLTSLNPLMTIGEQFVETIQTHEKKVKHKEALERSASMLENLGIEPKRLKEYPHQMSGGMRQRIMIGIGLVLEPDLLIADEPTTALDVIVEAQFLDLLKDLCVKFNLTTLLITHNLGVVAQLADRITVMYGGRMAETGTAKAVFADPKHPYSQGLLASVPNIKLDQPKLSSMPGSPPDLVDLPTACVFAPRCPQVMDICKQEIPECLDTNGHKTACWLYR